MYCLLFGMKVKEKIEILLIIKYFCMKRKLLTIKTWHVDLDNSFKVLSHQPQMYLKLLKITYQGYQKYSDIFTSVMTNSFGD